MALTTRLVLAALLLLVTTATVAAVADAGEVTPPPGGDFFIRSSMNPATVTGRTGQVYGSLVIEAGARFTMDGSTLVVDENVQLNSFGTLIMYNSTIAFNCMPRTANNFVVFDSASLTMRDKDTNASTTYDRSVLTSTTSLNFNFTALPGSLLSVMFSHVEQCGRYNPSSVLPEGLLLRCNDALVESTSFSNCTAGIVLDTVDNPRILNCTIDSSMWGIFMRGVAYAFIEDCAISQCSQKGIVLRGFQRNLQMNRCTIRDCTFELLEVITVSGNLNSVRDCTFGPNGQWGMRIEGSESLEFIGCEVSGCSVGVDVTNSLIALNRLRISDCAEGLSASGGALTLEDLSVVNSTARLIESVATELICTNTMVFSGATCEFSHVLRVKEGATLNVSDSTLVFSPKGTNSTGLIVQGGGSLTMVRSSATSAPTRSWYLRIEPLSNFDIRQCTLSRFGPSATSTDKGVYVGGSGHLVDVTIEDSQCGVVAGRTQAKLVNITVRRCEVALFSDGALGRGTLEVENLVVEECPTVAKATSDGSVIITASTIVLSGEGFNLSKGDMNVVDSTVGAPATGRLTGYLTGTSSLRFINSTFTEAFGWGTGENEVSILWYLDLQFRLMEPEGSPLVGGTVTILDAQGTTVVSGVSTGLNGRPPRSELRERSLTAAGEVAGTPHTVRVTKGGLADAFQVRMNRSRSEVFNLDNVAPSVNIISPTGGSLLNTTFVVVTGSALDTVHGPAPGLSELAYRLDGGAWDVLPPPAGDEWSLNLTVHEGEHNVDVRVKDAVGNPAFANVTFSVDVTPPELEIVHPTPHVTNKTQVTVMGTTEVGAMVKVNGVEVTVGPAGSFSIDVDLVEGPNAIVATAMDLAGNLATSTVVVELDTMIPTVLLDTIPPRTNATAVVVSGTKEAGATLFINGALPQLTNATEFEVTIELREGPNQISIESLDAIGNRWYTTLTVSRDSTPPTLNVVHIAEYTRVPRIVVQGTTERGATVTVNGLAVTNVDGTFSTQVDLVQGLNTILVVSRDDLFNYAPTVTLTVSLDTVPPTLKLTTNRQLSTDLDHALVEGTTDPGMTVKVKVTYGAYSKTYAEDADANGSFSLDIELPQVGKHSLTVTVEDQAGNQASETLTFDRVFPKEPPTPEPQSEWLANNWVYLVLAVSVVASVLIVTIILVPSKRQKAARRQLGEARLAQARTVGAHEGDDDEEARDGSDEGAPAVDDEDAGDAGEEDEGWVEEEDEDGEQAEDEEEFEAEDEAKDA